ncbi:MAG TPA: phosphoribosyl-ATP diphosphatase [Stellaceae bacterium]|jgi:phosphoribosyl-ATP pyrophosphohydrolase|nr:phosphoribosyl-ATP diphosphatase [Stellaceae bacterium]
MANPDGTTLDRLYTVIASRRGGDPALSYSAKLLAGGAPAIAKKLGEETVETIIEAVAGEPRQLAAESADLLYHLLVLWAAAGVTPAEVWQILEARAGTSGLAEKAARQRK